MAHAARVKTQDINFAFWVFGFATPILVAKDPTSLVFIINKHIFGKVRKQRWQFGMLNWILGPFLPKQKGII